MSLLVETLNNPHELRRIAAEAICDPGTLRRYLYRAGVRSTSRVRIEAALKKLGLSELIQEPPV